VDACSDEQTKRKKTMEIERKYLISNKFKAENIANVVINITKVEQGYLNTENDIIRIRKTEDTKTNDVRCFITIKRGRGLVREEYEAEISEDAHDILNKLVTKRIKKTRYAYTNIIRNCNSKIWEVDFFEVPKKLILAEVELRRKSENVKVPEFLVPYIVREVTNEDEYVNYNLAKKMGL
jgi:CYTH domain-containing protein